MVLLTKFKKTSDSEHFGTNFSLIYSKFLSLKFTLAMFSDTFFEKWVWKKRLHKGVLGCGVARLFSSLLVFDELLEPYGRRQSRRYLATLRYEKGTHKGCLSRIGVARFELTTFCSQSRRSTRLSYTPITRILKEKGRPRLLETGLSWAMKDSNLRPTP